MSDQSEAILKETLTDLYYRSIPHMDAEQPKKMAGEARRICLFGEESFEVGFLYGLKAGFGMMKDENGTETNDSAKNERPA